MRPQRTMSCLSHGLHHAMGDVRYRERLLKPRTNRSWPCFAVPVPKGSCRRKSGVIIQGHIALEPADHAKPVLVNRKAFRGILEPRQVRYSRTRICSLRGSLEDTN